MKNSILFLFVFCIAILFSCNQTKSGQDENSGNNENASQLANNPDLKLQVYYFHSTMRCKTCNSIEDKVKQAIETNFKQEVSDGIISFASINVDEEANKTLAEKYLAYGSALHLVAYENGAEKDNDLTEFAFTNIHKENDAFLNSLRDTIQFLIR